MKNIYDFKLISYEPICSIKTNVIRIIAGLVLMVGLISCEDFLSLEPSAEQVTREKVFNEKSTAIAAISGIYHDMLSSGNHFASGGSNSTVVLAGLSADELDNVLNNDSYYPFETNTLTSETKTLEGYWQSMYNTIYQANAVYEGVSASQNLDPETTNQLLGEALFIRAFSHFYLVNVFGDVPLIITTDYIANAAVQRSPVNEVYNQIVEDLVKARDLLTDAYPGTERIRPNKATATALLARVYLYLDNWTKAVEYSSELIDNTTYQLEDSLNEVFLASSEEAIWQLKTIFSNINTNEGITFILTGNPSFNKSVITDQLISAFEENDKRFMDWVGVFDTGTQQFYFPYKYKVGRNQPLTEYSIVLRLAEQYLIRAEAQAHLGNLSEAIADVDVLRERAGLPLIQDTNPTISQTNLLLAIEHERQIELFVEWGHRWLDLKRTGRADAVLAPIKVNWEAHDKLYPIPQLELNNNPKLTQNEGY